MHGKPKVVLRQTGPGAREVANYEQLWRETRREVTMGRVAGRVRPNRFAIELRALGLTLIGLRTGLAAGDEVALYYLEELRLLKEQLDALLAEIAKSGGMK